MRLRTASVSSLLGPVSLSIISFVATLTAVMVDIGTMLTLNCVVWLMQNVCE